MRILHTADWHLGHTLREHSRAAEHDHFLRWLVATVVERRVDVVLIAGDVFDAANPPPVALRAWFQFLGDLKRAAPAVQVVVIAGNHDSAARLEAPRELLAAFDVRVIGSIERGPDGQLVTEPLLVPLRAASGEHALCVAIPFLRANDVMALSPPPAPEPPWVDVRTGDYVLPRPVGVDDAAAETAETAETAERPDPLLVGMRALHDELFAAARRRLPAGAALVALAHGYLVGGALSELSERKVLGGNQHALPLDLFPDDCAYIALGHLHRPQLLAQRDHVRYSGSPIPLSMPERLHAHHVVCCDLRAGRVDKIWSLRVPQLVPLLRLPDHGALLPAAALAAIEALPPRDPATADDHRPLVEVVVQLPEPSPQLGERIARAIADRQARLVRVEVVFPGLAANDVGGDAAAPRGTELASLTPEQVFAQRYAAVHGGEPSVALRTAFRELVEIAQHEATS